MDVAQAHVFLQEHRSRLVPAHDFVDRLQLRSENDCMRIGNGCRQRVIGFGRRLVAKQQIDSNRGRLRRLDAIDQPRELIPGPRPTAFAPQAVLIDSNDECRTMNGNRSGKPHCEIVGGGVQLSKIGRPGQQQDCNGHDNTGGYRSEQSLH